MKVINRTTFTQSPRRDHSVGGSFIMLDGSAEVITFMLYVTPAKKQSKPSLALFMSKG